MHPSASLLGRHHLERPFNQCFAEECSTLVVAATQRPGADRLGTGLINGASHLGERFLLGRKACPQVACVRVVNVVGYIVHFGYCPDAAVRRGLIDSTHPRSRRGDPQRVKWCTSAPVFSIRIGAPSGIWMAA